VTPGGSIPPWGHDCSRLIVLQPVICVNTIVID
jgi:hypothetical protein